MNMAMKLRLEKTVDYHQKVVEHHQALHEEWLKRHKRAAQRAVVEEIKEDLREEGSRKKPPAPQEIAEEELSSPHSPVIEMHAEAARQLREVLDSTSLRPSIVDARQAQADSEMPRRDQEVGVRPVSRMIR